MIRRASIDDYTAICDLLQSENLPTSDLRAELSDFLVDIEENKVVAAIGMEHYGQAALLRSMVVHPSSRSNGIASSLVSELTGLAKRKGVQKMFLITNTAEHFFERKGFVKIDKANVDDSVLVSGEFNGLCPASSTIMLKHI